MNYLPSDLIKIVINYSSPDAVLSFSPITDEVLINNLVNYLGLDPKLILTFWNYPENLYDLTSKDRYIRVLAYFNFVVPGAEKFLSLENCYQSALKSQDLHISLYFGEKLGKTKSAVEADLWRHLSPLGKFLKDPQRNNVDSSYFKKIKKGELPTGKNFPIELSLQLAALYNHYNLIEQIVSDYNLTTYGLDSNLLEAYIIKGDLNFIKEMFPKIPEELDISEILYSVNRVIPRINVQILEWIASEISKKDLEGVIERYESCPEEINTIFLGLLYQKYPSYVKGRLSYNQNKTIKLTAPPLAIYIQLYESLYMDKIHMPISLTAFLKNKKLDKYNLEDLNIIIVALSKSLLLRIGKRTPKELTSEIIAKIKSQSEK